MSIRIMADGKAYDRTDRREVRTCRTGAIPGVSLGLCATCGGFIHRLDRAKTGWAHNHGTFWENDMPRWR
jgi:coenzyme F420-reducing hydrogenase gamma subunit